jgi:hypothetical protein
VYVAETWTLRKAYHKYLESVEMCTGEGWRRSVEPIMSEMEKYYTESRRRGISCKNKNKVG